ncbi:MAG: aspartate aminotransferase family protein [Candidatus Methylacidiphilales bacterium]
MTYIREGFPIFWDRAEGASVWDVDGNRFLDLTSGFGVAMDGFGDPTFLQAAQAQIPQLYHAMGDVHPARTKVDLCRLLSEVTFERWGAGEGKSILGNSGFEAVEAALKTACLATGRKGVVAFEGSYHGLGLGALATTALPPFAHPFRKVLADFTTFLPYPYCYRCPWRCEGGMCSDSGWPSLREAIRTAHRQEPLAAILVEPAQGRAGEIFPPDGFLRLLREAADEMGALLIFDEIFTGFWRTGEFFACELEAVVPDLICLGKALTRGFPLSACVGRAELMDTWPESDGEALHTSTFLGNPIGCAVGSASLRRWLEPGMRERVRAAGEAWDKSLRRHVAGGNLVGDIRGRGLMWGIELVGLNNEPIPVGPLVERALADGMILLGGGRAGNVISLSPSLAVAPDTIDWVTEKLAHWIRCQET